MALALELLKYFVWGVGAGMGAGVSFCVTFKFFVYREHVADDADEGKSVH